MLWKYAGTHEPIHDDNLIVTVLDDTGDNEFTYTTVAYKSDDGYWYSGVDYDEEEHEYERIRGVVTHWMKFPRPAWD